MERLCDGPSVKLLSPLIPVLDLLIHAPDQDSIMSEFQKVGLLADFFFFAFTGADIVKKSQKEPSFIQFDLGE